MAVLKTILTVVLILISIIITAIILCQEGKSAGLGAIAGASDTYWSKHKDRSMEAKEKCLNVRKHIVIPTFPMHMTMQNLREP